MTKPTYLTNLTALRGIAALLILVFHFNLFVMPLVPLSLTTAHQQWYLFVDFFFVLSGFVMMHVYGDWFANSPGRASFGRFMAARFARVYPLHLFTFLWVLGLYGLLRINNVPIKGFTALIMDPAAIPWQLILAQAPVIPNFTGTWNTPSWSISMEWWAYVLFPFLVRPLIRPVGVGRLLTGIILLAGYLWLMLYALPNQPVPPELPNRAPTYTSINVIQGPLGFLRCLLGFGTGLLTHTLYTQQWGFRWLRRSWTMSLLFGGLMVAWHVVPNLPDLVAIGVFVLLILMAAYNTTQVYRFLNTKPLQRIGDWSYSIYLVHIPIIFTFLVASMLNPKPGPPTQGAIPAPVYNPMAPVLCLTFLCLTVALAALLYGFLEKPARHFFNARFRSGAGVMVRSVNLEAQSAG